jgi:hypothetical protein
LRTGKEIFLKSDIGVFYEKWNASRISVGKPEGRRPLGRPIIKWILERERIEWYGLD